MMFAKYNDRIHYLQNEQNRPRKFEQFEGMRKNERTEKIRT